MISVVFITNRGLYSLVDKPDVSIYDILSLGLEHQTLRDGWEVVVCDSINPTPRKELNWLGDRVKYCKPCRTPWLDIGAFAPSTFRNSALALASGSVVLGLDDCVELQANVLETISRYADNDQYLVPVMVTKGEHRVASKSTKVVTSCGGIVAYPRKVAISLGGHEERFSGAKAFDDWEFSQRLSRAGVRFIQDGAVRVVHHKHTKNRAKFFRCHVLVMELLKDQTVANQPWTEDQVKLLCEPCKFVDDRRCQISRGRCGSQTLPSSAAIKIMRNHELTKRLDLGD